MIGLNTFLLLSNGAIAILGCFLIYAVAEYLLRENAVRGIRPLRWLGDLPVSMQLGVGIVMLAIGIVSSFVPLWVWRQFSDGRLEDWPPYEQWVAAGRIEMTMGILCLIRVVSRPRYGHRLWMACLAAVAVFIVVTLGTH